ncbi:hypothetical protein FIBSPDRAFT_677994, partial [Athelia psychrophila]
SFKLDLPSELKQRGIHDSFHAQLLRIHIPNDDRRFPGRQVAQLASVGNSEEWAVDKINSHRGKARDAEFEVIWKSGDSAWMPYHEVRHLAPLSNYLEAIGVDGISRL